MDNTACVNALLEMAEALEFLEENPFKVKAYRKAARSLASLDTEVGDLVASGQIMHVSGVGASIAATLKTWVLDRDLSVLEDLRNRLPQGYPELMKVAGLGMKRLRMLTRDLGISSVDDLHAALEDGRLSQVKGFSDRGIARLKRSVLDVMGFRGWYLLDAAWRTRDAVAGPLADAGLAVHTTGECRRGMEVMDGVDLLCADTPGARERLHSFLSGLPYDEITAQGDMITAAHPATPPVRVHMEQPESIVPALFVSTGSPSHLEQMNRLCAQRSISIARDGVRLGAERVAVHEEAELYGMLGLPFIPPEIREGRAAETDLALSGGLDDLVREADIVGVIHVHTSYSDGRAGLADMAQAARDRGYAWMGVSDHSKNAYYAGGLSVKDLTVQLREIDAFNDDAGHGITILKGIESDILPDGSLDYPDHILRQLDFVIASIHSHMDMDSSMMTDRIIKAVRNPFTTILGHPTGRLLLSRRAYEVDMEAVLAEAAQCRVAIELNGHPMRLDLDWRLIPDFIAQGGRMVISPDAHTADGFDDMRYGVAIARKGLLTRQACINCLSAADAKEALRARWS